MSASLKMRQLQSKISGFQNQYQDLLKERQQEIASLISAIDLAHLDDKILLGGLLFIREKITTQDPILEAWHDAGEKFLRQHKSRAHPRSQPRQGKSPTDRPPQAANKKHLLSKQNPTPQATDQPHQEHSQQGEE